MASQEHKFEIHISEAIEQVAEDQEMAIKLIMEAVEEVLAECDELADAQRQSATVTPTKTFGVVEIIAVVSLSFAAYQAYDSWRQKKRQERFEDRVLNALKKRTGGKGTTREIKADEP